MTKEKTKTYLGERIRAIRDSLNISPKELASRIGVSYKQLVNVESKVLTDPDDIDNLTAPSCQSILIKLRDKLNVSEDFLVFGRYPIFRESQVAHKKDPLKSNPKKYKELADCMNRAEQFGNFIRYIENGIYPEDPLGSDRKYITKDELQETVEILYKSLPESAKEFLKPIAQLIVDRETGCVK